MECEYCGRPAKNLRGHVHHQIRCPKNPNRISPSYGMLGKKGANQYTYGAVMSEETKAKISKHQEINPQIWTNEQRELHSQKMKLAVENHPESYTSANRGRTKQIEYNGIKFQGNWELEFYKWAQSNGYNIVRNTKGFPYHWNGNRTYFPDFYLVCEDAYVEVKGYETDRDQSKWSQFPNKLYIIKDDEINKIRKKTFTGPLSSWMVRAIDS